MVEGDRQEGMGDRGEHLLQSTTSRYRTRVSENRTWPEWYVRALPGESPGRPKRVAFHLNVI